MRTVQFIIWFSIFISIYLAVNFYIFLRMWQSLPGHHFLRMVLSAIYIFFAFSYWLARFIENVSVCCVSDVLFWTGSFWFGAMLYFFLAVLFLDILRAGDRLFHYFPVLITENMPQVKIAVLIIIITVVSAALMTGTIIANNPVITERAISIKKPAGGHGNITIALVTDIHMGTIVKNAHLETMVSLIREINPDLVFLGGDMVDEDMKPVIKNDLGDILQEISSKYPTYAITGNHEYYGGINEAIGYLEEHSVIMLRDRMVKIMDRFYLAGRDDKTRNDFEKEKRKDLKEIIKGADRNYPIILMDHNPAGFREAAAEGIDLMLSGHTHHGQLWPMNFITSRLYTVDSGYGRDGSTQIFVSNGFGTWGPPVRLGSRPEVVKLIIRFE